ncbi:hypothetical protein EV421DRAFT_1935698 [Armillaria borealis]|uniref:Uncharacterized protein n=1 Tax=Armillaria borealis TaxID=47425 RepID=A0AA39ITN7_9AGAR|nr:hypothetical protein EV421DRAFT_1935698 [Armillaria borealis]
MSSPWTDTIPSSVWSTHGNWPQETNLPPSTPSLHSSLDMLETGLFLDTSILDEYSPFGRPASTDVFDLPEYHSWSSSLTPMVPTSMSSCLGHGTSNNSTNIRGCGTDSNHGKTLPTLPARNQTSSVITSHLQQLEQTCMELCQHLMRKKHEHGTLQAAYVQLLKIVEKNIKSSSSGNAEGLAYFHSELEQPEEFADDEQKVLTKTMKSSGNANKNIGMHFVTDIFGEVISGERAKEIHSLIYAIWVDWAKEGRAPEKWRLAGDTHFNEFMRKICQKFLEVSYCSSGWKSDMLSIQYYLSWHDSNSEMIATCMQRLRAEKLKEAALALQLKEGRLGSAKNMVKKEATDNGEGQHEVKKQKVAERKKVVTRHHDDDDTISKPRKNGPFNKDEAAMSKSPLEHLGHVPFTPIQAEPGIKLPVDSVTASLNHHSMIVHTNLPPVATVVTLQEDVLDPVTETASNSDSHSSPKTAVDIGSTALDEKKCASDDLAAAGWPKLKILLKNPLMQSKHSNAPSLTNTSTSDTGIASSGSGTSLSIVPENPVEMNSTKALDNMSGIAGCNTASGPSTTKPEKGQSKQGANKMKPSESTTPRALCANDWITRDLPTTDPEEHNKWLVLSKEAEARKKSTIIAIKKPISIVADDAPYLGIKLVLMQTLRLCKGDHDDIERFIGDCIVYFEAFASYFHHHSQMVPFTASYFEGSTKDWWVYKCQEFWMANTWDATPA